jgi:hypothetical protein
VKPLLVINSHAGAPLINAATGAPTTGLIGQPITLNNACTHQGGPGCSLPVSVSDDTFVPAQVANPPNPDNLCPSCRGGNDYEQSIECCDFNNFVSFAPGSAPSPYSCGGTVTNVNLDNSSHRHTISRSTNNGVACLIDNPSPDLIDASGLQAGSGPAKITAGSGPQAGNLVTTSRSIVSLPIIDPGPAKPAQITTNQLTVLGFLQVFIESSAGGGNGAVSITGTILNVIGCGNNPSGTTVAAGSSTAIPVRLIHQ